MKNLPEFSNILSFRGKEKKSVMLEKEKRRTDRERKLVGAPQLVPPRRHFSCIPRPSGLPPRPTTPAKPACTGVVAPLTGRRSSSFIHHTTGISVIYACRVMYQVLPRITRSFIIYRMVESGLAGGVTSLLTNDPVSLVLRN